MSAALEFVRGLCEEKPEICDPSWVLGYSVNFVLLFKKINVRVTLTFNVARKKWSMEMWSNEHQSFLFWNECGGDAMAHLVGKFGLTAVKDREVEADEAKRLEAEKSLDKLIKKVAKQHGVLRT